MGAIVEALYDTWCAILGVKDWKGIGGYIAFVATVATMYIPIVLASLAFTAMYE